LQLNAWLLIVVGGDANHGGPPPLVSSPMA
jgi:hypothetical protein